MPDADDRDIAVTGAAGDVAGGDVTKTTVNGADPAKLIEMVQTLIEYQFLDDQRRAQRQEQQDRERAQEREERMREREDMVVQFASIGGRIDTLVEREERERVQTRADHTLQFTNTRHHMELHGQRIDRLGQRVDYVGQHIDQMTTEQHQANARIQRLMTVAVWIVVVIILIIIALVAEFGGFVDVPIALIAASLSLALYYVSHR